MPRPEKVQAVTDIKERIDSAKAVFLAEYAGLSVQEQQKLRRSLRQSGAEFKVVKMTLARLAAADLEIDTLDELLLGPTGLAFADDDAVTAAKALRAFAKDHDGFTIKGGLLGREFLTPERINQLASIESREVLLSRLLSATRAPMANLAGLLAALPRGLATAFQQLIEKMPADPDADLVEVSDGEPEAAADDVAQPVETEPVADEEVVVDDAAPANAADDASAPEAVLDAAGADDNHDEDGDKSADDADGDESADDADGDGPVADYAADLEDQDDNDEPAEKAEEE